VPKNDPVNDEAPGSFRYPGLLVVGEILLLHEALGPGVLGRPALDIARAHDDPDAFGARVNHGVGENRRHGKRTSWMFRA
jgi:hypothetical protein